MRRPVCAPWCPRQRFLAVLLLAAWACVPPVASQEMEDVLYLKDGTGLRGIVVARTLGESVEIQGRDGSVQVYAMDEISRIAKEPVTAPEEIEPPGDGPASGDEGTPASGIVETSAPPAEPSPAPDVVRASAPEAEPTPLPEAESTPVPEADPAPAPGANPDRRGEPGRWLEAGARTPGWPSACRPWSPERGSSTTDSTRRESPSSAPRWRERNDD